MNFANLTREVANESAAVAASATHFCPSCGLSSGYAHSPSCDVLTSAQAAQVPVFVQSSSSYTAAASVSSAQTNLPNQAAGNTNVVCVFFVNATGVVSSVTDSAGNIYTPILGPIVQATDVCSMLFCSGIAACTNNAVTAVFSQASTFAVIFVAEYSGIAPGSTALDISGSSSSASGTAMTTSVTTTNASDIVIGFGASSGGALGASGQTQRISLGTIGIGLEDQIVTTAGAKTMTWTAGASAVWIMCAAAFKSGRLSQVYPGAVLHD